MPGVNEFDYTFDNLADVMDKFIQELGVKQYSLYVMDYGAPVGFRIAVKHPERVQSLIVQNGNAYDEGLLDFWKPFRAYWNDRSDANATVMKNSLLTIDATHWQYTNGVQNVKMINPDNWLVDQTLMDRPGNKDIQLRSFIPTVRIRLYIQSGRNIFANINRRCSSCGARMITFSSGGCISVSP